MRQRSSGRQNAGLIGEDKGQTGVHDGREVGQQVPIADGSPRGRDEAVFAVAETFDEQNQATHYGLQNNKLTVYLVR